MGVVHSLDIPNALGPFCVQANPRTRACRRRSLRNRFRFYFGFSKHSTLPERLLLLRARRRKVGLSRAATFNGKSGDPAPLPEGHNREAYAAAKGPFIWTVMQAATDWSQSIGWEPGPSDA
jgi:hypothetical protein